MNKGKPAYLQTFYGKYVFIESKGLSDVQMVAKSVKTIDARNSRKVTVTVIHCEDDCKFKCMAFCFELKNKKYFPAVTGNTIGFEENLTNDKKFWFRWVEQAGVWKTLKSVAKPNMYLCERGGGEVTIEPQKVSHFKINFKNDNRERSLRMDILSVYPSIRYSDDPTCRIIEQQSVKITDNEIPSEESNHIEIIQDKIPMYPNTRHRKYMSVQSNDDSTCRMVVENVKNGDNGNPSEEERHIEMIQDSRPMYRKTRHRTYMWAQSKDGSTSQMVVENIKISDDRNPSKASTRRFIAVKRKLNDTHNLNDTTKDHRFWSNLGVKKIKTQYRNYMCV